MQVKDFPFCCTAKVICDLGGTTTSEGGYATKDQEDVEKYLHSQLTGVFSHNVGLFTVITNSQQETVNAALRKLGFGHSPWASKTTHAETKVRLWWKSPEKYKEELKALKEK